MEIVNNSFMPGDPRLIQQLVYELKSQGIFDQFRKECIADVDTKPAYQNLRQRVEGSVTSFLSQQTWRPDMNKNQVWIFRGGVERIVDQVVNPKINTVFLPQVEEVVYRYLGIEKPNRSEVKKELKIDVTDLLPTDLEAVSPESDHSDGKNDDITLNSLNTDSKLEEDESPPFEPIEVEQDFVQHEENSVDSHLSGFSGLQSHDSNPYNESKMEISNQDSQISQNSSESHLSIITSDENTKMDICEDSESKLIKPSDSELKMEIPVDSVNDSDQSCVQKDGEIKKMDKPDQNRKEDKKTDQKKYEEKNNKHEEKKLDEKKYEKKGDDKKVENSKDKKDKYKKSSSSSSNVSSNKDKDKSSSKYTSSSSSKEKDKSKDKKEGKNSSSSSKEKVRSEKEKSEKERSDKDKEKSDRDRNKSSSGNNSRHSSGNNKEKERTSKSSAKEFCSKDKESSSRDKESCSKDKDKEKSRASSSSTSRDSKSKSGHGDTKSKSSLDKHKKSDKASHNGRPSSSASSSTKRDKDKDKKRESKKESKDDHYSAKEKKNNRRSTDRDSNDGHSSKPSQSNSLLGNSLSRSQKISQESPNLNGGTGSGDSGSLDNVEQSSVVSYMQTSETTKNKEIIICADVHKFKYVKPKFASNFEEARKLMKIRKQLARLEKQNQLRLAQIDIAELPLINGINCEQKYNTDKVHQSKETMELDDSSEGSKTPEKKDVAISSNQTTPVLQSKDLSKESWEALEARLAQEMSNVNYDSYESPYDDYDCTGYNSVVLSPRKKICFADEKHVSPKKFFFKTENNYIDEKQTTQTGLKTEKDTTDEIHIGMQEKFADMIENKGQEYKNEINMETDTKLSEMIEPTKDEYENTTDSSLKTDEDQKTTKDALVKMVTPSEIENKK
ncbi:hypothetical protein NQ318_001626 [Aromia moschata]|uniref:BOD1/SHG1 domain-containing protein n=1 Tax=Aromia moschata TaxID=1265417 RepID=A0AAV8Y3J2_9CUCU|nr:hypothetical protein NQ318_001626 [Aromia moschata]